MYLSDRIENIISQEIREGLRNRDLMDIAGLKYEAGDNVDPLFSLQREIDRISTQVIPQQLEKLEKLIFHECIRDTDAFCEICGKDMRLI